MSSEGTVDVEDAMVDDVNKSRRSWWPIGLALLGLVVVLLLGGVVLSRQFRPSVGVEPGPTPPPAAQATSPLAAAPPASVAVAPTAMASVTSAPPTGVRIASSPLEKEVEDAYLHYWDVLRQAYLNVDGSRLSEVMADAELRRQEEMIADLQSKGRAAKIEVDHRIAFANVSAERAVVYDEYLNRSVFLDAATKRELPTKEQPETEKISFEMRKIDVTWKVVDATRHD